MRTLFTLLLTIFVLAPAVEAAPTAIVGGTVYPVSGPAIENGTVLIDEGRIVAVGRDVTPPADAERVDATGMRVYPGMIAAFSVLGLVEVGSVKGTDDISESFDINPNARALVSINPDSELIPVTRANGILTAVTANTGGVLTGTSAAWNLHGWTWEDMAVREPLGIHLKWPSMTPVTAWWQQKSPEEQKKEREARLEKLTDAFDSARAYAKARRAMAEGGPMHPVDVRWEAMLPALRGEMKVFIHADEIQQIEAALDFAREYELDIVLIGGRDAPRVADRLAAERIPVIIDRVHQLPRRSWEPYDAAYTVAARLHEAGVSFCITSGSTKMDAAHLRNLPYQAAMAAAYGLPREEALKAVTRYPAVILGLDELGTLEPGKMANLFIADGDPLEILTNVHRIWIAGEPVGVESRHTELYERYRNRPRTDGEETRLEGVPGS